MIVSFDDRSTWDLYHGIASSRARRFPAGIVPAALRALDRLNAGMSPLDLAGPGAGPRTVADPSLHEIAIGDGWRVTFRWQGRDVHGVQLTDAP